MTRLDEVSRKNLVGKTKVHSPARYNKRLRYSTMSIPEIDEEKLLNEDILVIHVRVGQYVDTLSYDGVMQKIISLVEKDPRHRLTRRIVVQALNMRVDETDVFVNCSCEDFRYRFAYFSTKYNYKYGSPETRPSNITNPHDSIGAVCKHLACILANKQWLVKASSVVNDFIHENYTEILYHANVIKLSELLYHYETSLKQIDGYESVSLKHGGDVCSHAVTHTGVFRELFDGYSSLFFDPAQYVYGKLSLFRGQSGPIFRDYGFSD